MPSGLARRQNQVLQLLNQQQRQLDPVMVEIRGPWLGYVPDIEPSLLSYSAMTGGSRDLLARGEFLVLDAGWSRVDPTNLPLGDDGAGAGAAPASGGGAIPQSVNLLDEFFRLPLGPEDQIVAVTADMGGGSENSHIFKLLAGGTWTDVPPVQGASPATVFSFDEDEYPQALTWPDGIPSGSPSMPGGVSINEPVHVIVAPGNDILFWPSIERPANSLKEEYDQLIERRSAPAFSSFKANSVALFGDRLCYLNTSEGGTTHERRMRYSVVGDPTDLDGVGAGAIDAFETCGPGLRLEPMGDLLVGYFCNTICFYRRTFNPLIPFEIEYLNKHVTLMGLHAIAPINEGLHFGIYEEGWFWLDPNGNLREAGVFPVGQNPIQGVGGTAVRRWHKTFYDLLDPDNKDQTQVVWDATLRLIRISFVSKTSTDFSGIRRPDRVWLYDPEDDRVWPTSDYNNMRAMSYRRAPRVAAPGVTWLGTAPDTWNTIEGNWLDYGTQTGAQSIYHGTRNGYVVVQDATKQSRREQQDGSDLNQQPLYVSHLIPLESPALWKEVDRLDAEVLNITGAALTATLTLQADSGMLSVPRSLNDWPAGNFGVAYMHARLGGTHLGFKFEVSDAEQLRVAGFRMTYIHRKGMVQR